MRIFLDSIRTLVYPSNCLMCDQQNRPLCTSCRFKWQNSSRDFLISNHKVSAAIPYDDRVARIVLSAKEDNSKAAKDCILLGLNAAFRRLVCIQDIPSSTLLISIPSSRAANRRRGGDYLFNLSHEISKNSKYTISKLLTAPKVPLLIQKSNVRDQSGLTARERTQNMDSAIYVNPRIAAKLKNLHTTVLLMDDVITSGATLKSAITALEASKITVIGAIAACASRHQMRIP